MRAVMYSILSSAGKGLLTILRIPSPMHTADPATLNPHALGQRIATLRRANGWSQRRLAEAAGVSHGYIALLELGRLPSPGKFRLDAVARALNVRTSDALLAAGPVGVEAADPEAHPGSEPFVAREALEAEPP